LVFIKHPGLRGLSMIRTDVGGAPILAAAAVPGAGGCAGRRALQADNTRKRLAVLVASICRQLREIPSPLQGRGRPKAG
jgi:hypothetical protein